MEPNSEQEKNRKLEETFQKVEEMLKKAKQPQGTAILTPKGLAIDIYGAIEIVDEKEQISLFNAQKGDIVWWTSESGTSGYYLVDIPSSKDSNNNWDYGIGELKIIRKEGHPLGNQQGQGIVYGAQIGSSMMAAGRIIKGMPLEYFITVNDKPPVRFDTTDVTDMGIIKAATLNQP